MDHFNLENLSHASLIMMPVIALGIGLVSSPHCIGMCGGLALMAGGELKKQIHYQFGRLLSYLLIGSVFTLIGESFRPFIGHPFARIFLAALLSMIFIILGLRLFRKKRIQISPPKFLKTLLDRHFKNSLKKSGFSRSLAIGFGTLFLPCGLLWTVVLTGVALPGTWSLILVMFGFWLGGIPALSIGSGFLSKVITKVGYRFPKLSGLTFIFIGTAVFMIRIFPLLKESSHACH